MMPMTLCAVAVALLIVGASAAARAQQLPPPAPVEQGGKVTPQTSEPAPPSGAYTYKAEGRRDPFVSLLGRASDSRSATNRPTGLAGFLINEVVVTGIVKTGPTLVAMLRGPDNKTYIVRTGERLMDGSVKSISDKQVVFSQDVNDPLSLIKQREIPKSVRPGGESME
jgi:Tfp pilus assembly protein PilP